MTDRRRLWTLGPFLAALLGTGQALADPVPPPSHAEIAQLTEASRGIGRKVVLVGHPQRGQGTAFVISRSHRLLATAAHVADLYKGPGTIWAVPQGTGSAIPVVRVWYHPSLHRIMDDGLTVRSPDPADGPVAVPGPDVAVLQLANDGTPLPEECELASPEELRKLDGLSLALLGYPGYGDWPTLQVPGRLTLKTGKVQVVDGFTPEEGAHPERRQMIEHSAAAPEGSSGSPVFLPNGHIVAIHNILRLSGPEGGTESGMSVRLDCLWELLAYHKLDRLVPIPQDWLVLVPTGPQVDPKRADYRRAKELVREAEALSAVRDYRGAGAKCNQALALAPDYPAAFLARSRVFTGYCGTFWASLPIDEKRKQADWAIQDAKTGFLLAPDRPDGLCLMLQNALFLGHLDGDRSAFEETLAGADSLLSRPFLEKHDRSFLTNCRAQARHYLGDWSGALKDYNESIRLAPSEPIWYLNRAQYWDQVGRPDLAAADRRMAQGLRR